MSIKRIIDKQDVSTKCWECVEKAMRRQLAILYRNAGNLIKSNIDVGGETRWRRWFIGTYVESWVLKGMKIVAVMSRNQCKGWSTNNKLLWDFKIQTDNKIEHDKPDTEVLDKIERQMSDYWCCLSVWHPSERQMERENWELPEAGVKTDLEIAQGNCVANHNWCIRNYLERYRKVVTGD